jgi:hypothetical protein
MDRSLPHAQYQITVGILLAFYYTLTEPACVVLAIEITANCSTEGADRKNAVLGIF